MTTRSFASEHGVTPVINACGIYTDLGGSRLSPGVWEVAREMNETWVSMPELLEQGGARIAELTGAEAAWIVPGASAGLALAVGACIAGRDAGLIESLPDAGAAPHDLLMQAAHDYKYVRCALMAGARLRVAGEGQNGTGEAAFAAAIDEETVAILHPAHLDGAGGTIRLEGVAEIASPRGVPVVVDAAYMSYPTELIGTYTARGADLACFSAKYFWGPNAGGFITGRRDLIEAIAALDFTHFESGPHLAFGRAFKMDRGNVAATVAALEEWLEMDHDERWASYERRVEALRSELEDLPAGLSGCGFTLDERVVERPVNSLLLTPDPAGPSVEDLAAKLAQGSPSLATIPMAEGLVLCLETVEEGDDGLIAERLRAAMPGG